MKRQRTKKQAGEGRGTKCRDCYINMVQQMRIDGSWDWLCERCGRTWEVRPTWMQQPKS